ncbi:transposase family protein [Streptomyces sp. NPDC051133]|uniref:transposase family protein n=1 Tax=Streptomyces sp. NPDC051133 TaxID=3155521 RepID=UPI00343A2722
MCRQSATVCLVKSPTRQHRATGALAERLATLADPRCRRGKRHPFVAVLLIACSAVVSGARSFVAIDEWATDAPQDVLAQLGAHTATALAVRVPPSGCDDPAGHQKTPAPVAWPTSSDTTRPVPTPSRSTARAPAARAWAPPRPHTCWPR